MKGSRTNREVGVVSSQRRSRHSLRRCVAILDLRGAYKADQLSSWENTQLRRRDTTTGCVQLTPISTVPVFVTGVTHLAQETRRDTHWPRPLPRLVASRSARAGRVPKAPSPDAGPRGPQIGRNRTRHKDTSIIAFAKALPTGHFIDQKAYRSITAYNTKKNETIALNPFAQDQTPKSRAQGLRAELGGIQAGRLPRLAGGGGNVKTTSTAEDAHRQRMRDFKRMLEPDVLAVMELRGRQPRSILKNPSTQASSSTSSQKIKAALNNIRFNLRLRAQRRGSRKIVACAARGVSPVPRSWVRGTRRNQGPRVKFRDESSQLSHAPVRLK
ncbi:hypothetical protein B0T10DRAFT_135896 [Thelonectria olida]|uniref:Uncharacterized protein n=1 Tax=Thelonectria olida TaxID=1576542 RepID=A0A9P8VYW3_9HYPO|nr:hypothetical protein B0T10DRAFT_135896 [Thelonectria olida]